MAKFDIADKITGINEGGYANNPSDRGGETYAGIARKFWGSWPGWKYIDKYKADYAITKLAGKTKLSLAGWVNASAKVPTEPVRDLVVNFYKKEFWDANRLGQINDQQVANSVYDFGVNSGKGRAVQFLEAMFHLIKDGLMDPIVIKRVNESNPERILTEYNSMRRTAYLTWAKGDQRQFLNSWLSRLKPYQLAA
jgi:lysozyme family protein